MPDIAELGVHVDVDGIREATKALDEFTQAADRARCALKRMVDEFAVHVVEMPVNKVRQ